MAIKVLLVDDSAVMRKVLIRSLRQAGVDAGEILEASDGVQAIAALDEDPTVDVVLCDWNMPNMSGIEFVVRARGKGYEMPIVMVTTEAGDERVQQALDAGANGFVNKPFTPDSLEAAFGRIFQTA